jgi:hypothetical protein
VRARRVHVVYTRRLPQELIDRDSPLSAGQKSSSSSAPKHLPAVVLRHARMKGMYEIVYQNRQADCNATAAMVTSGSPICNGREHGEVRHTSVVALLPRTYARMWSGKCGR